MKSQLLTLILSGLLALSGLAQSISRSSSVAAGDEVTSNHYSLSWSLGEIAAYSAIDSSHHLTGGFQQGELVASASSRNAAPPAQEEGREDLPVHKQIAAPQIEVLVYPNPTVQSLTLRLDGFSESAGQVFIFDAQARPVITQPFDLNQPSSLQIHQVASLPPGNYFLQIHQQGSIQSSSTFVKI